MDDIRQNYIDGLRDLADWYAENSNIALPDTNINVYGENTKAEASKVLRALSPCDKDYTGEMFFLKRAFKGITLQFVFYRNQVCEPVVVGKKTILARTIPEQVIPQREEDVVEWHCHSLLGPTEGETIDMVEDDIPF